jgi:hypothetical protein
MPRARALEISQPPAFFLAGPARQARLTFHGHHVGASGARLPALAVLYGHPALDLFLATERAFSDHLAEGRTPDAFRARVVLQGRRRRRHEGAGRWEFASDRGRLLSALDLADAA